MENSIENILQNLGLTNAESKVYLALLKLGEGKIGSILKIVDITPSNVHESLEKLSKKGLISFIQKNKVKCYKPAPVKSLIDLIKKDKEELNKKEKELNVILPQLDEIKRQVEINQDAEIFFELRGIKSALAKLLGTKVKGEEYLFFYKPTKENVKIVHDFFSKLDKDNESYKNFPTKGIFDIEYKKLFSQRKDSKIDAKFTSYPIPSSINIYNDKVLIIAWSENPIGFLIQSREIAQTFKDLFFGLWETIKNPIKK